MFIIFCPLSLFGKFIRGSALPHFTVSPFLYDGTFSLSALSRLEGKGLQVLSALDEIYTQLAAAVAVTPNQYLKMTLKRLTDKKVSTFGLHAEDVLCKWIEGQGRYPPTWRALLQVLKELNLGELSQRIEDYLTASSGEITW